MTTSARTGEHEAAATALHGDLLVAPATSHAAAERRGGGRPTWRPGHGPCARARHRGVPGRTPDRSAALSAACPSLRISDVHRRHPGEQRRTRVSGTEAKTSWSATRVAPLAASCATMLATVLMLVVVIAVIAVGGFGLASAASDSRGRIAARGLVDITIVVAAAFSPPGTDADDRRPVAGGSLLLFFAAEVALRIVPRIVPRIVVVVVVVVVVVAATPPPVAVAAGFPRARHLPHAAAAVVVAGRARVGQDAREQRHREEEVPARRFRMTCRIRIVSLHHYDATATKSSRRRGTCTRR